MNQASCALNISSSSIFIDHISPLASLMKIPLFIPGEANAQLTRKYYPNVEICYQPNLEFFWKEFLGEFETIVQCGFWGMQTKWVFTHLFEKKPKLIFCPHGQSDKGYLTPSLAKYAQQEEVLLYGPLMRKMLQELNLWDSIPSFRFIGNFRFLYYQKHREFLSKAAHEEIFSTLPPTNKTLLYAPTWQDADQSGSLPSLGEKLLAELPSEWNLILKLHPLTLDNDPKLFYRLSFLEEHKKNFRLIHDFPAIYPLIEKVDAYLGDYSSVGYDVLTFQKPMFFFQQPHIPAARLHSCGEIMNPQENFFLAIEKKLPNAFKFQKEQQKLYNKAFAPVEETFFHV